MGTRGEQFAGVTVALVTPFRNGDIDEARLRTRPGNHAARAAT